MRGTYSEVIVDYLLTGEAPPKEQEDASWEIFAFTTHKETVLLAWDALREELLPDWIREYPGTRPWGWWKHDAPKMKAPGIPAYHLDEMVEPRLRIGGSGAPTWEKYPAIFPYFTRAIPDLWEGIDPEDPPRYESEASFLDRHGFLSAAEQKALPPHAFDPEKIQC